MVTEKITPGVSLMELAHTFIEGLARSLDEKDPRADVNSQRARHFPVRDAGGRTFSALKSVPGIASPLFIFVLRGRDYGGFD